MEIKNMCAQIEACSDGDLEQLIAYASRELISRHTSNVTYEDEFMDVMLKCGLNVFSAKMSLRDFKEVSAVYMQIAEPLFIEDIQQVLKLVLGKNDYEANLEADRMLGDFVQHSFGNNIPSIINEMAV